MNKYLYSENQLNGGTQKVYKFPNGYGASVVQSPFSYGGSEGLWELAVIDFDGGDWVLTYSTPITDDVIGRIDQLEVNEILERIKAL